jgi:hypothetical protein
MGKDDGADNPKLIVDFGLERRQLTDGPLKRLNRVLKMPFNGAVIDLFGDNVALGGGMATMILADRLDGERVGLGWVGEDMSPIAGAVGDCDWLVKRDDWDVERIVADLNESNNGRFVAMAVGVGGEYSRVDIEANGVIVASVRNIALVAEYERKLRESLGEEVEEVPDWVLDLAGAPFKNWATIEKSGEGWEVLGFKRDGGLNLERNEFSTTNVVNFEKLLRAGKPEAYLVAGDFLAMMGRLFTLKCYGAGFGDRAEDMQKIMAEFGQFFQLAEGFKKKQYNSSRSRLAERMALGLAFDVDAGRQMLIKTGLMAVFSEKLAGKISELSSLENQAKFSNAFDLVNYFDNGLKIRDIGRLLVVLGIGCGLNREEYLEVMEEMRQYWNPRPIDKVAKWGGRGGFDVSLRERGFSEVFDDEQVRSWQRLETRKPEETEKLVGWLVDVVK